MPITLSAMQPPDGGMEADDEHVAVVDVDELERLLLQPLRLLPVPKLHSPPMPFFLAAGCQLPPSAGPWPGELLTSHGGDVDSCVQQPPRRPSVVMMSSSGLVQ